MCGCSACAATGCCPAARSCFRTISGASSSIKRRSRGSPCAISEAARSRSISSAIRAFTMRSNCVTPEPRSASRNSLNGGVFPRKKSVAIQRLGLRMALRRWSRELTSESVMTFRKRGFRAMVLGLLATAAIGLAPAAFARTHYSVGVSVPGVTLAYGHGWHGHGHGYVGFGGYYGGYYPGYYYGPAYYGRPYGYYYGRCYAPGFYDRFGYYHGGYYYAC